MSQIINSISAFLLGALKVIVVLGALIGMHEFGHFIMAKLFKIKVHKFSIGFGPRVIHKKGKETEYSVRAIPLGGFVQLEGEDVESDDPRSFSKKPIWQRIIVLLAGVTVNISFAIIVYLSIYMSLNYYVIPQIDASNDQKTLESYGLEVGDTIYKIDGRRVYNDFDINQAISKKSSDEFLFTIIKKDSNKKVYKNVVINQYEVGYIGIALNEDASIAYVLENSVGDKVGFKAGDKVLKVNNNDSLDVQGIVDAIKGSPKEKLQFIVLRDEKEIDINVVPDVAKKRSFDIEFATVRDVDFFNNLQYAWNETKCYIRANVEGIMEFIRGTSEEVELTGIVGISSQISKTENLYEFFYMMSAISLSLGIMNLLPIPGLDGGKILFTLIEAIRGKPVSKAVEGAITLASFSILMFFMIYVTVGDISKLFG